jgi:hypothetical protein
MNIVSLLIIIIAIILIYKVYQHFNLKKNESHFDQDETESSESDSGDKLDVSNHCNTYEIIKIRPKRIRRKPKKSKKCKLNPYFQEVQFHTDYQDTLAAFQKLAPNQKQLFNRSDSPITKVSNGNNTETKNLIKNFIKSLNNTLDSCVSSGIKINAKSGWEKQQEKLGLPGSLYVKPAEKSHVRLVKIDRVEKYEICDEIRFSVFLTLKKENVSDQMVIKVNFFVDKKDYNSDRNFFKKKRSKETNVVIEEIFIIGFLTKDSFGKPSVKSDYTKFNENITDGRMFSQEEIIKQLNEKRRQYEKECEITY